MAAILAQQPVVPGGESQLAQYGILGTVLLALGAWYVRKDFQCERMQKESIAAEQQCRKELGELHAGFLVRQEAMLEKYRAGMEKMAMAMDSLAEIVKNQKH